MDLSLSCVSILSYPLRLANLTKRYPNTTHKLQRSQYLFMGKAQTRICQASYECKTLSKSRLLFLPTAPPQGSSPLPWQSSTSACPGAAPVCWHRCPPWVQSSAAGGKCYTSIAAPCLEKASSPGAATAGPTASEDLATVRMNHRVTLHWKANVFPLSPLSSLTPPGFW